MNEKDQEILYPTIQPGKEIIRRRFDPGAVKKKTE